MGERATFGAFVEGTTVVVGHGRRTHELVRSLLDGDVIGAAPSSRVASDAICLVVLDGTSARVDELATFRADLPNAPAVLLLPLGAAEPDPLPADDAVHLPAPEPALARRLRSLRELGRTRLALTLADQALAESVSGLTVADVSAPDQPLVHVSPVFEAMTGFSAREALGTNCRFLRGPDTDAVASSVLRDAIASRRRGRVVLRNQRRDGTTFWNEVTVFPIGGRRGGEARWMGGVQHDVTELVEARAELDVLYRLLGEQRSLDRAVLGGLDVGVVTAAADGRVRLANRAAAELLQAEPAALVDRPVHELLGLEAPPGSLLAGEVRRVLTGDLARADGTRLEVEVSVSRVGADAQSTSFFFVLRDRTRDRQLEMERQRLERLAAIGTMVAGFAHEVRNPVASLRSLTESLAEELAQRDVPLAHISRMLRALERIERLVRTSLQFGRPDTPRRAPHRPWTLLGLATEAIAARTKELGGDVRVEVVPDLPDVFVDETQLVQVLVVLLNNALDATGASSLVRARARRGELDPSGRRSAPPGRADAVRFEVEDDGPGIPAENLGRIFDPFFTTKSEGTGLGLSIAQQLVSENGGRLEVTSPRGGPTVFAVTLPTDRRAPRERPPRPEIA